MSRSTQFIGLTKKAQEYVSKLEPLNGVYTDNDGARFEEDNKTFGMFDEDIPLGAWKHPERGILREIVQESPWSSGPMIFTCLAWDIGNRYEGDQRVYPDNSITLFEWTHNPSVKDVEFDPESGELWV